MEISKNFRGGGVGSRSSQPDFSRGKAEELGRRRVGTLEFPKDGLCPITFLLLSFSSLRPLALEMISSHFSVLGNSVLIKRKKLYF